MEEVSNTDASKISEFSIDLTKLKNIDQEIKDSHIEGDIMKKDLTVKVKNNIDPFINKTKEIGGEVLCEISFQYLKDQYSMKVAITVIKDAPNDDNKISVVSFDVGKENKQILVSKIKTLKDFYTFLSNDSWVKVGE